MWMKVVAITNDVITPVSVQNRIEDEASTKISQIFSAHEVTISLMSRFASTFCNAFTANLLGIWLQGSLLNIRPLLFPIEVVTHSTCNDNISSSSNRKLCGHNPVCFRYKSDNAGSLSGEDGGCNLPKEPQEGKREAYNSNDLLVGEGKKAGGKDGLRVLLVRYIALTKCKREIHTWTTAAIRPLKNIANCELRGRTSRTLLLPKLTTVMA